MKYPLSYRWLLLGMFRSCLAPRAFGESSPADRNWAALHSVERGVVGSGDHVGNVYLLGECVSVPIPDGIENVRQWRVADEMEREIARGELADAESNRVDLGDLPVGWYWIGLFGALGEELGWTTAAVLAPLAAPTPQDSPICVDSAVAWFAAQRSGKARAAHTAGSSGGCELGARSDALAQRSAGRGRAASPTPRMTARQRSRIVSG